MSNSSSWPWPSSATTPRTSPGYSSNETSTSFGGEPQVRGADARRAALGSRRRRAGAGTAGRPRPGCDVAQHQPDDPLLRAGFDVDDPDRLAFAQDGRAVAHGADLDHPMRDEDDRAGGAAPSPDDLEDAFGQVGRKGGGHLVEHQHGGLDRERTREVDDPQRRERQRTRGGRQVEARDAELRQPGPEGLDRRAREPQVRGDVEVGDERRFLVDRHDPASSSLARAIGRRYGLPRTRIVPRSGWTAPVRILTRVLLPAPLAPMSAWTSPGRTASEADRRAATAP